MNMIYKTRVFLLILICGAGLILRMWDLGKPSLWVDEAYSINGAQAVLDRGVPLLDSGQLYKKYILTAYVTAGAMKLFPFDPFCPWAVRVPAVLFGVGVILMIYLLANALFKNNFLGIVCAFIMSFSIWEISWSRQARGYTILTFFVLVGLFLLWRYFENERRKYLWGAILAFGTACLVHALAVVMFPAMICMMLWNASATKSWKRALLTVLLALFSVALVFKFLYLIPGFSDLMHYQQHEVYSYYIRLLWYLIPVYFIGSILGSIVGVFDKTRSRAVIFLSIAIFVPVSIVVLFAPLLHFRYIFPFFPLMTISLVYAIYRFIETFASFLPVVARLSCVALIVLAAVFPDLNLLPRSFYPLEPGTPQLEYNKIFAKIKSSWTPGDVVISPDTVLSKIYLGEKGAWLAWGRDNGAARVVNGIVDFYTAAPVILNGVQLKRFIDGRHGFIITNNAVRRKSIYATVLYSYPKIKYVMCDNSSVKGGLCLYKF